MIARIAATVVDGELKLDEPIPLPARTRVTVTIEPVSDQANRQAAWERFQRHGVEWHEVKSWRLRFTGKSSLETEDAGIKSKVAAETWAMASHVSGVRTQPTA